MTFWTSLSFWGSIRRSFGFLWEYLLLVFYEKNPSGLLWFSLRRPSKDFYEILCEIFFYWHSFFSSSIWIYFGLLWVAISLVFCVNSLSFMRLWHSMRHLLVFSMKTFENQLDNFGLPNKDLHVFYVFEGISQFICYLFIWRPHVFLWETPISSAKRPPVLFEEAPGRL